MALRNVGRNWNRTGMIILSMLAASAIMTLSLSLAGGYPEVAQLPYRQMLGADILVYPNRYIFSGASDQDQTWEVRRLGPDLVTDAAFFHPELKSGYLAPVGAPPPVFDLLDLPSVLRVENRTAYPDLAEVTPARLLRAYAIVEDGPLAGSRVAVIIRGRDLAADHAIWSIPDVVTLGSYPGPERDGERVAVVNGFAAAGLSWIRPGTNLRVEVPRISGWSAGGLPVVDHAHPVEIRLEVLGRYRLDVGGRSISGLPAEDRIGPPPVVPMAIDEPEIWIPAGTFDQLYEEINGSRPRYVSQLHLRIASMANAKILAAELGALLPECTVLTVPQEVSLSGIDYVPYYDPDQPGGLRFEREYHGRAALSADISREFMTLAFVVAGLLVVANMYIMVSQRRREIGVIKAVGATSGDVFTLILVETLGYALAGSLIGFFAVRLLTLIILVASSVTLVEGVLLTLHAAAVVVGSTTGIALLFGFLPAWEAARTPSATLLGDR